MKWYVKKERNPLHEGHVKDIGSKMGVQSYMGQGCEGGNLRGACVQPYGANIDYVTEVLSGTRVVRILCVCGCPQMLGGQRGRWGCGRVCLVTANVP
jgi:hypothetical protein